MSNAPLFLGLDSSTQGLKATMIDARLDIVYEQAINFDADLPEFGTQGGVHRHPDGITVTSPAIMWVAAVDLLFARMLAEGAPLDRVAAVSGSGQQHGSVWLGSAATRALGDLVPERSLREQLAGTFSMDDSPVWMDMSTGAQCRDRERALGGAQALAERTGSRAYERFTGNQIARWAQERPDVYAATERIALVSAFIASLLIGEVAPVDVSDGSGMNLMDIRGRDWIPAALDVTAPDLQRRLGRIVPSHATIGTLNAHFVQRYGMPAACIVIAFSGDNPNSLAGLRLGETGDVAISLGTSDTLFGSLREPAPSATEGHIFVNPVDPDGYMALMCRKNGSITRERVRDDVAGGDWGRFEALLSQSPPGNAGRIGMYWLEPEITPPIARPGMHRVDAQGETTPAFAAAGEVRALLEGQFLCMRLHGDNIGIRPTRLIATGGASVSRGIIHVIADVFGTPVFVAEKSDSASLGAAYRALHGWRCRQSKSFVPFAVVLAAAKPFREAAKPDPAAHTVYTEMLPRFREFEDSLVRA